MYQLDSRKYWSDTNVPIQFEFRNPQFPFPLHIHDFHEIALIYSGKAVHLTTQGDHDIEAGDFISVKLGQAHGYKNIRNLVLMNVLIKPSFFEEGPLGLRSLSAYEVLFGREPEEDIEKSPIAHFRLDYWSFMRAKELIEAASSELAKHSDGYQAMVMSFIQELIVLLIRNYRKNNTGKRSFASEATGVISYVKHNYRSPLTMDILTGISGLSKSHILRTFKRHLGLSPFQYISQLRLSDAADALIQTDKSITEIALDMGFNDSNYFTRSFRKYLGLSPREYRNKYLKENLL
jgi:AraC-like DNA-binding protein